MFATTSSRGLVGVVNAIAGAAISAFGHFLQRWARERSNRHLQGLEPPSRRAYIEGRLAVSVGLLCVACGLVSGVVGDALLPISTQAPLAAIATALRALLIAVSRSGSSHRERSRDDDTESFLLGKDDDGPLHYEGYHRRRLALSASTEDAAPLSRRRLHASLLFIGVGPSVALLGASLDDRGGMSAATLCDLLQSRATFAAAGISVLSSIYPGRTLASSALSSALASAWAHAATKAFVELALYYRGLDSFAVLVALVTVPIFVALKLRVVAGGLNVYPKDLYMPVYQALAIAANAICGILVFDDFGYFSPQPPPRDAGGVFEPTPPSPSFTEALVYWLGVACTVFGVLLTVPDDSHQTESAIVARDSGIADEDQELGKDVRWRLVEEEDDAASTTSSQCYSLDSADERRTRNPFLVDEPQQLHQPNASTKAATRESWDSAAAETAATSAILAGLPIEEDDEDDRCSL